MFGKNNSEGNLLKTRIKECPLFSELSGSEVKSLLEISHIRDYSENEKIFTHGTIGLCFYIIVKGSVKIISENNGAELLLKAVSYTHLTHKYYPGKHFHLAEHHQF